MDQAPLSKSSKMQDIVNSLVSVPGMSSRMEDSDKRPVAVGMGITAAVVLCLVALGIVLLDLDNISRDLKVLRRNVKCFSQQIQSYLCKKHCRVSQDIPMA